MSPRIIAFFTSVVILLALSGCGGLQAHRDLLVPQTTPASEQAVKVTYLGCNAFLIESGETSLLVDPFFSRPGFMKVALGRPIPSNQQRIDAVLARLPDHVDAILVTHAHYDHLMDVPSVRARLGGTLIASPTSFKLVGASGSPANPGELRSIGGARVQVLEASHDTICGILPFPGGIDKVRQIPPRKASDYPCGQPLAFLITIGGKSIYIDSGGTPDALPPNRPKGTDLAILGCALPDSRNRFLPALAALKPRIIFPSHQDNFFRPLDRDFRFGLGTNMRNVRKRFESSELSGRLVLMDFFDVLIL